MVSCFEIYGGKLFDLLNERNPIKCLEDARGMVQTPGLSEHAVDSVESLLGMMSVAHLQRSTGNNEVKILSAGLHEIYAILVNIFLLTL